MFVQLSHSSPLFFSSLQFFMLILLIFLAELAAAILAFIFREHVSRCCFLIPDLISRVQ